MEITNLIDATQHSTSSAMAVALYLALVTTFNLISLPAAGAMTTPTSNRHSRSMLPSRPVPFLSTKGKIKGEGDASPATLDSERKPLDVARLIGMTRVGQATASLDGVSALFEVKDYGFAAKKIDEQLWRADLSAAESLSDDETRKHAHLVRLTAGSDHGWTTAR